MHIVPVAGALALVLSSFSTAAAQEAFTGAHADVAITAVDHHFVIEEEELPSGTVHRFNVTRWGVGGQAFAGYDLAIAPRVVLGAEGAFDIGGRAAVERNSFYTFGDQTPARLQSQRACGLCRHTAADALRRRRLRRAQLSRDWFDGWSWG